MVETHLHSFFFAHLVFVVFVVTAAEAFAPPVLGIGAVLFKPNVTIRKSSDLENGDALARAGEFFVEAFWTGKVGGAASLSTRQASLLERQQVAEFRKRYRSVVPRGGGGVLPGDYASRSSDRRAELLMCVDAGGECVGCAGVEVEKIKKMDGYDSTLTAPLMSNLAVSRRYRRRGLAEDLVRATEAVARREWGYDECYLYVEKRNFAAVKLYNKMGYKKVWEDDTATTMLPTEDGGMKNGRTTIVCMKKRLGGGIFGGFF